MFEDNGLPMIKRPSLTVESIATAAFSFLLVCLLRPDFFLSASIRFTSGHDIEIPFQAAFIHAGYFINGAIDLWNRYDHTNHAYIHLGTTFHSPAAIVEGALFAALHSLFARPGEAFQHFHAIAFFFLACLLRTVGGVALLSLYNVGRGARIISLILLNTLVALHNYDGSLSGFAYSLTPLVLFYVAVLLRSRNPATLVLAVGAYCTVFSSIPLLSLGYGYMPIHFVVVVSCCFVVHDMWREKAVTGKWPWAGARLELRTSGRIAVAVVAVAVIWIVATNFYYLQLLTATFSVSGSGLGETEGRFENLLRPWAILKNGFLGPRPEDALIGALNFEQNDWWQNWMFIGASVVGLFVVGLIVSKRREKWIYVAATLMTAFAGQAATSSFPVGLIPQVITAFTNPFAFLIRDTAQSAMLVPYLMWPVVAFGVEAILDAPRTGTASKVSSFTVRQAFASIALTALIFYSAMRLPPAATALSVAVFLCLLAALLLPSLLQRYRASWLRFIPVTAAIFMVACDLGAFGRILMHVPYTGDLIQPRLFTGLEKFGPLVIDYQNPAIMPLPRHMYVGPADDIAGPRAPTTDPSFPADFAVYFIRQDYPGAFFHSIFASRHFAARRIYEQRGIRFKDADVDVALQQHLQRNDRYIYHASQALDARNHGLKTIVDAGANSFAAVLENPAGAVVEGSSPALGASRTATAPSVATQRFEISGKAAGMRVRRELVEFEVPLPSGFPRWVATTVFGRDGDAVRLVVDGQTFVPAQGHLIRPFSFDVGNVRTGYLVFALPTAEAPRSIHLEVDQDPLVRNVTDLGSDRLTLDYQAPSNGWMVIRNPYEEGWRATVNGKDAPIYVANGTAMAVPVLEGLNRVMLQFKPGFSVQRILVVGYIFFGPFLLFLLTGYALHIVCHIRHVDSPRPH